MEFKIRASGVSQIMTNGRSKTEVLGQTCKTFLEDWYKEQIYGFRKEIKSKYLTKGLMLEDTAIEFYSIAKEIDFMIKNLDHFSDDFMQGTPDLIHDGIVYDFKTSWDAYTFPLFDTEPDKGYVMQLQVYMHLTGLKKAKLVYTLQNTPEFLTYEEPVNYDDVDLKYRVKEFEFDYDAEFIESVKERVLVCREYLLKLI
jgi:hypothetical protein